MVNFSLFSLVCDIFQVSAQSVCVVLLQMRRFAESKQMIASSHFDCLVSRILCVNTLVCSMESWYFGYSCLPSSDVNVLKLVILLASHCRVKSRSDTDLNCKHCPFLLLSTTPGSLCSFSYLWLIDWIVFYVVSAILQSHNGGPYLGKFKFLLCSRKIDNASWCIYSCVFYLTCWHDNAFALACLTLGHVLVWVMFPIGFLFLKFFAKIKL